MNRGNLILIAFAVIALFVAVIVITRQPAQTPAPTVGTKAASPSATPAAAKKIVATPAKRTPRPVTPAPTRKAVTTPAVAAAQRTPIALTPAVTPNLEVLNKDPRLIRDDIFGPDEDRREQGLNDLSVLLENGKGLEILAELFRSTDTDLRDEALVLLPSLEEQYRLPFITMGLENEDPEFRLECLSQLRDIAEVNITSILMKALDDKNEDVLEEVSDLFFYFSDKPIYQAAAKGLNHEKEEVRAEALSYLEDTHTPESVELLIEALNNPHKEIVEGAGDALRFMLDAEIEGNNYNDWIQWWKLNKDRWSREEASEMEPWDINP